MSSKTKCHTKGKSVTLREESVTLREESVTLRERKCHTVEEFMPHASERIVTRCRHSVSHLLGNSLPHNKAMRAVPKALWWSISGNIEFDASMQYAIHLISVSAHSITCSDTGVQVTDRLQHGWPKEENLPDFWCSVHTPKLTASQVDHLHQSQLH